MAETVVIEFLADTKGLQPAVDTLESIGGIDKTLADEFRKNNAAIQDRIKLLDQTGQSAENLAKDFKKVSDSVKVEGGKKQLEDLGKNMNEAVGKSQRLTTQLRSLKQQLSELDQAGQSGSKAFQKMAIEAAKLEDQIGDTAARVRGLASDTKNIDAVVGVVSGLASAFSVAQGAAALLGGENEDLQKGLLKVQAAMAIANGVQQLQNTLQKQNIVVLTAKNAYTAVAATVTGLYTGSTTLATVATAAWNAVLNLNPIVAITTAITLAVGAIYQFIKGTDDSAESIKEMNKQLAAEKKSIEEVDAAFKKALQNSDEVVKTGNEKILDNLETQIELAKLRGASLTEIFNLEKKLINDKLTLLKNSGNADTSQYNALLNDKLILTQKYHNDLKEEKRKSEDDLKKLSKREQDELSKLPINNPVLAGEQQKAVEKQKTDAAYQGAQERQDIAQAEADKEAARNELKARAAADLNNFIQALGDNRIASIEEQARRGVITEEKAAKEIAKIKRAQALASKGEAIFNILISQPQAIAKTLATLGIVGTAAIPVILGLLGAEIGAVLAQPIPKFAKGTRKAPAGMKLVGEEGPELIYDGGGYPIIPNGDTEKILSKWIPATPYVSDSTLSKLEQSGLSGYGIDYDLLGKSVAKHMSKIPQEKNVFDEDGWTKFIYNGVSRREIKSKRGNF